MVFRRSIATSSTRMAGPGNAKAHETAEGHGKIQTEKALNPHMTNTNSTIANEIPKVGAKNAPPELISSIDPEHTPTDSSPENTERMTGGTQKGATEESELAEMGVGEMEGAKFKIEPLHRSGEDANTMRARLLCSNSYTWREAIANNYADQSRKRGTLESDLLMSTFADSHLINMTPAQMAQYDKFLDENDWDIYYWATQEPTPTSQVTAEGSGAGPQGATGPAVGKDKGSPVAQGTDAGKQTGPELETDEWRQGKPRSGEWAQTVGTFKPAYRPVPARWKNSEILAMLRRHVVSRSAGGLLESDANASGDVQVGGGGKVLLYCYVRSLTSRKGMAFMPPVFQTDRPEH